MAYNTDTTIAVNHSCGHTATYKARGNLDPKKIEIALKHIGPTICPACEIRRRHEQVQTTNTYEIEAESDKAAQRTVMEHYSNE